MTYRGLVPLASLDLGLCDTICRVTRVQDYGRGPARVTVEDATAEVVVRCWDCDMGGAASRGGVVKVRIVGSLYQGLPQFTVSKRDGANMWRPVEDTDHVPPLDPQIRRAPVRSVAWDVSADGDAWRYTWTVVYPGPHTVVLTAGGYATAEDASAAQMAASARLAVVPPEPDTEEYQCGWAALETKESDPVTV